MADENSGQDRLNRLLQGANTGEPSSQSAESGEDSFEMDDDLGIEGEDDEDAAPAGDEDDTSDTEDTTEDDTDSEGDEPSDDEETDDDEPATEPVADEDVVEAPAPTTGGDPMVAALQQQISFLQAQMLAAQQPVAPPPSEVVEVPDDLVVRTIFQGMTREDFAKLPQNVQENLSKVYERYSRAEARYAKNPALRYEEQFKARVEQTVRTIVEPLLRAEAERETDRLISRHLEPLAKTPEIRKRAVQIFQELPGSNGDWVTKERVLAAAVKLARAEVIDRKVDATKKTLGAKKAQARAAGGGKLKGAPSKKGNGKSGGIPDMRDNEKPEAYARRIAKFLPTE